MKIDISKLTYDEIRELIPALEKRGHELRGDWYKQKEIEWKQREQARATKKKEFEKNELPKIKNYLFENLISNFSVIKVKGARDGKGIRLFLAFNGNNGNILECRQIRIDRVHNGKKFVEMPELGQITQHMIDKVTHVKIDGEFIRIGDLIK